MLGWGWVLPGRVRAVLGLASSEGSLRAPGQLSSPALALHQVLPWVCFACHSSPRARRDAEYCREEPLGLSFSFSGCCRIPRGSLPRVWGCGSTHGIPVIPGDPWDGTGGAVQRA